MFQWFSSPEKWAGEGEVEQNQEKKAKERERIFAQITPKLRLSLQVLRRAFEKRDIGAFRKALNKSEDIENIDDNQTISLFEEVCQTPGSAAFISECLQFGCDANKVSVKK